MTRTTRHVALLRGVNVGGNRKVPMTDLAQLFRDQRCEDVVTYVNSGNVVFTAKVAPVAALEAAIVERFGFEVPLVVRTAAQWRATIAANPLGEPTDLKRFHVLFLKDRPTAAAAKGLDPQRSPGEPFRLVGSEVFVQYADLPRSKLTNTWFDKTLGTVTTARNWTTVHAIAKLLGA